MKLTVGLKLRPTSDQAQILLDTLETANKAANEISRMAWENETFGQFALHRLCYHEIRQQFNLSAQAVVRAIAKVADSYKLDRNKLRVFNPRGSIAYDDRLLSWNSEAKGNPSLSVSIWTTAGRQRIPFTCGGRERNLLPSRQGETDLLYRGGEWYLYATVNYIEPPTDTPDDFLGVDLGITNIATDSDGRQHSGGHVKNLRRRHRRLRKKLQAKGTKSAKRLLRKRSRKETRFAKDVNHCISKRIIQEAKRTKRAVVLEELTGIRSRIRARKSQRADLHSWAFAQLRAFIQYKAVMVGVLVVLVDARNSSRECSQCGYVHKLNRPDQSTFVCRCCGYAQHADINAALVLRDRGRAAAAKDCSRTSPGPTDRPPFEGVGPSPRLSRESVTKVLFNGY